MTGHPQMSARRRPSLAVALLIATIPLAAVALAGCAQGSGGSSGTGSDPLNGRTFLSTSVRHAGQDRPLVSGTRISLEFTDRGLIARPGCNIMSGPVRLDGGRLVVTELATTDMGCAQPQMDQDTWFAGLLNRGPTWQLTGDTLVLTADQDEIRLLDRRVANPDKALVGTHWVVDTLYTSQVAESAPADVVATLDFGADGILRADTSCVHLTGPARVVDDRIEIGALTGSDALPCPTARAAFSSRVANLLTGTLHWHVQAERLTLTATDGTGLGAHSG
jgi:heat shock protein HslJ